jgi:hypothetical protein
VTARELAVHVLRQRFGSDPRRQRSPELAAFQQEAHERLLVAIDRHGGALLADSVGLGKTFVAAVVARSRAGPGTATIAAVPSSLVRMWRRALQGLEHVTLITHARLSRSGFPPRLPPGLLIVDEAHAFRNPRTRRYAALARLAQGRPVLLLTATPVNNSVWDLYWLLRLFADDAAFIDIGVEHLAACFEQAHRTGRSGRIPAVLAAAAVRRNRTLVTELYGGVRVGGRVLGFPRRAPPSPVRYDLPEAMCTLLVSAIEELELAPWREFGPAGAIWLLRLLLLKRLESSTTALRASLSRLHSALQAFTDGLAHGLLLAPTARRAGVHPEQLELEALVHRRLPPDLDAGRLGRSARRDLRRLRDCLALLDAAPERDPKFVTFVELLERDLEERPVLLFTEFRETAEYLWHALRDRVPCALIHGSGAWLGRSACSRRAVIERFAPIANGVPPPAVRERVRLLIATDVLAEGLNLQDAADLVSYDLPWNPVRLVQRLGRIDRLGSAHGVVRTWYFVPQRELEQLLGLLRRIRAKLRAMRATVGPDAPVLAAGPRTLRRLATGDPAPFQHAERLQDGLFDIEERLRAALRRYLQPAGGALAGLPLGATSDRGGTPRTRAPAPAGAHSRNPPVAVLPALTADLTPLGLKIDPPGALVFVRYGAAQRAVFVGRRRCCEDDVCAGEILLRTLAHAPPESPARDADDTARAAVTRAAHRARLWLQRPPPGLPHAAAARRLELRLLRLLQEAPGGATDEQCHRTEVVVGLLRGPLTLSTELSLRPLSRQPARCLDELLHELEGRLAEACPRPPAPAPLAPGTGGNDLCHTAPRTRPGCSNGGTSPGVTAVFLFSAGG